jgi:N4-gp56 family major capsid protein
VAAVPQLYSGLTNAQRNYYAMMLLERAYPYMPMFGPFGGAVKVSIPEHMGTTAEWRAYGGTNVSTTGAGLALALTALTEGAAPAQTQIVVEKVTQAVAQYGAWVALSDLMVHQGIDPIWTEAYELLGEQAGQTLHTKLISALSGGGSAVVQYASTATIRGTGAGGIAAGMTMNGAEVREAVRTLARAKAPRFPDGYYHGLIHVDAAYDLKNDADWKNMNVYQGGNADAGNSMTKGTIGALHGVLFEESTDAPYFANGGLGGTVNVYGTLIFGPRWFGIVDLAAQKTPSINADKGTGMKVTGVPVETATKDDPLGQFGVAGWKCGFAALPLSPWKAVRIESAAS